jgi:hypothetical protein
MEPTIDKYKLYLESIIEKYTATPTTDPEVLNYALRPPQDKRSLVSKGETINSLLYLVRDRKRPLSA